MTGIHQFVDSAIRQWLVASIVVTAPAIGLAQDVQWTRQFGSAAQDRAFAIAVSASGVYVAGATQAALPGQRHAGAFDAFARKYDYNGVEVWTRQFGTPGIDEILAIALDAGGDEVHSKAIDGSGVYLAGTTSGSMAGVTGAGETDAFLAKHDFDGQPIWTRQFGTSGYDDALGIAVNAQGLYLAGNTRGRSPARRTPAFVVKLR